MKIIKADNNASRLEVQLANEAHRSLLDGLQGVRLSHSEARVPDWAGVLRDRAHD